MDVLKLAKETLGFDDLQDMLGPENSTQCRFLLYDQLSTFRKITDLWKGGFNSAIILLQKEDVRKQQDAVGHFILLLDYGTYVEHFDSYGLTSDEELDITKERHLTNFFNNDEKGLIQNTTRLQKYGGNINTCGRWVVARLLMKELNLKQFIKFVKSIGTPNDQMVTLMTMLLAVKR
jgi:hypothetical protein